ncbi:SBBP repeat-containing protein [Kordiimonas aquimaris]|uniref:SBBP repeat-containing protein n=1 Tax=Kordiimonas aquimaris TaxID=707591 RepID=UPI0021CE141F|nr:SBBP repeat-containing protein [Kordiimonas aquimaris]
MAFFGVQNSGGLFGSAGQQSFRPQIVGIDTSLIALSSQAQLARIAVNSLSADQRASFSSFDRTPAVTAPGQGAEDTRSLNQRIREVRELTNFVDLDDPSLEDVAGNVDQTATFVLFNALSNLRVLAEFAAEEATPETSLGRLDEQFQSGLAEVRDYISSAELNRLEIQLGERETEFEATTRTGRNSTGFSGSGVASSGDQILEELTGTETLTVSITKNGVTDDILVDLSAISGDLTLNNVAAEINTQIEALTDLNDEGEAVARHLTRFSVQRDVDTGRFGLQVDGTLLEKVSLSAAAAEPTLYTVSSFEQLDDGIAVTSRLSEFNNISGEIALDDTTSFAAIDYEETAVQLLVAEEEDDDLDPAIAARRDQFLADSLAEVTENSTSTTESTVVDNTASITNVNDEDRVNADTFGTRVATDSQGGIYVVGTSTGSFGLQLNVASEQDVFLTKLDTQGNVIFSRLLGAGSSAEAFDIKVDSQDNVIIAGATEGALSNSDVVESSSDAFVVKYNQLGDEVFRYQLDTFGRTSANSIAIDSNDDIFVGGSTSSAISATSGFSGGNDALILKLNGTDGALLDSNVFGTSDNEVIQGIVVDGNDDLIIAVEQQDNASVVRVSGSGLTSQTASVSLGDLGSAGAIESIAIDTANNQVFIAGVTTNAALDALGAATINGSAAGGIEGFVTGLSFSGTSVLNADFTTYVSTSSTDRINDLTVQGGSVFVAGSTGGGLSGETEAGPTDGFVARINGTTGVVENTEQFGAQFANTNVGGIAFTSQGDSVLETLGLPAGLVNGDQTLDLETQTTARVGDHFFLSIDDGRRIRIELDEGDDFNDIARQIRVAGFGRVEVDVSRTSEGDRLQIGTVDDGVPIDLIPGAEGSDLLERIGLSAGRLLPRDQVFGLGEFADIPPEEDLGGVFGLGLEGALNVRDRATARFVLGLLDNAIGTTQRAFRSLTFNPIRQRLLDNAATQGPVPPRVAAQIANFQSGLARLQSGASSSTLSLFA